MSYKLTNREKQNVINRNAYLKETFTLFESTIFSKFPLRKISLAEFFSEEFGKQLVDILPKYKLLYEGLNGKEPECTKEEFEEAKALVHGKDLYEATEAVRAEIERNLGKTKVTDLAKRMLPAIAGGTYEVRSKSTLINYPTCAIIDLDKVDPESGINIIKKFGIATFVADSFSGGGVFGIVPIQHPEKYEQHYNSILLLFENAGINLDKSCKNVDRLRIWSPLEYVYSDSKVPYYEGLSEIEPKGETKLNLKQYDKTTRYDGDEYLQRCWNLAISKNYYNEDEVIGEEGTDGLHPNAAKIASYFNRYGISLRAAQQFMWAKFRNSEVVKSNPKKYTKDRLFIDVAGVYNSYPEQHHTLDFVQGARVKDREYENYYNTYVGKEATEMLVNTPTAKKLLGQTVAEGDMFFLFAGQNAGKTTFAFQLGVAVAGGCAFPCGLSSEVSSKRVAYFATEMMEPQYKRLIENPDTKQAFVLPSKFAINLKNYKHYNFTKAADAILYNVEKSLDQGYEFIIIDNVSVFGGDMLKKSEAIYVVEKLSKLKEEDANKQITLMVIHHATKARRNTDKLEEHHLYGTSQFLNACDSMIGLSKVSPSVGYTRYLKTFKSRMPDGLPYTEKVLHYDLKIGEDGLGRLIPLGTVHELSLLKSEVDIQKQQRQERAKELYIKHKGDMRKVAFELGVSTRTLSEIVTPEIRAEIRQNMKNDEEDEKY